MTDTLSLDGARPVFRRVTNDVRSLQTELDTYYTHFQAFKNLEPDEVMVQLSVISARLIEIRAKLVRSEDRAANNLRTKEVDPLLEACEFQFKIWSRVVAVRTMDFEMTR